MKKLFAISLGLLLSILICPSLASAQLRVLNNYKQGLFLEVGGNSVGYSVNYEKKLINNPAIGITARVGLGATSVDLYAPVGLQFVFLRGKHHLVISPTATPRMELRDRFNFEGSDTFLNLNMGIGYRFQTRNSPIFAQAQFVPGFQLDPTSTQVTETDPVFQPRVGAAIGVKL